VERLAGRFGWLAVVLAYFLPVPNALVHAVVGWTGMRLVTFLLLDVVAALAWMGLLVGLGYSLGQHAVDVAEAISRYALWISFGLLAVTLAYRAWQARRDRNDWRDRRDRRGGPAD
jgi:membrane protein DedA with SNARE-associated domain